MLQNFLEPRLYFLQGPRLEQKLTSDGTGLTKVTQPISTVKPCPLDCGPGGGCSLEYGDESPMCLCPLGKGGNRCREGESYKDFNYNTTSDIF